MFNCLVVFVHVTQYSEYNRAVTRLAGPAALRHAHHNDQTVVIN